MKHLILGTLTVALLSIFFVPRATSAASGSEISSALAIAKSNNKNQVHYAVQVDASCAPMSGAPVRAYWRMLEKSSDATESLSGSEERAFGIERQDIDGDAVRVVLRGLHSRTFTIHTWRTSDGCAASTSTNIAGTPARIASVYVKLKLFGVDYVQLTGYGPDGAVVRERFSL